MSQQRQLRHSFLVTASRHELAIQRARHIAPTAPDRPARIYKLADHSSRSNAFRTLRRDGGFRKAASAPKKAWVAAQLGTVDQYLRSRAGRRHSTANSGTPPPGGGQHSSNDRGGGCKHMSLKKPAGLVVAAGSSASAHDQAHAVAHVDANYEMLVSLRAYYKVGHATDSGLHAPHQEGQEGQEGQEEEEGGGGGGSHFSDAALLQRESLRFDPGVLRQLERLWAFTDTNHDGCVSLPEYADMFVVLYAALQGGGAEEHVVRKLAREEFAHDAGGQATLSKQQFKLAWFQVCGEPSRAGPSSRPARPGRPLTEPFPCRPSPPRRRRPLPLAHAPSAAPAAAACRYLDHRDLRRRVPGIPAAAGARDERRRAGRRRGDARARAAQGERGPHDQSALEPRVPGERARASDAQQKGSPSQAKGWGAEAAAARRHRRRHRCTRRWQR